MSLSTTETLVVLGVCWLSTVILAFLIAKVPPSARFRRFVYIGLMIAVVLLIVVRDTWYLDRL